MSVYSTASKESKSPEEDEAAADFSARAPELADWADARLINRRDAYGSYRSGGQVTRRGTVNRSLLIRHFQAAGATTIIGSHAADADNRGRWGALDIDQHGDDPALAEINLRAALHWYDVLVGRGFHPLLTESNGRGGFHLRVLLAESIDAARLYHFLRRLVTDHRETGLDKPPEHFPKQADVRMCVKGMGNWLRLPGRHPKREFYSRVWDGSRWLAGHAAIDFMLSLTGDDAALIPDAQTHEECSSSTFRLRATGADDRELALLALAALSPARFEDYKSWLEIGMALHSVDSSASMLEEWDRASGCAPDKHEEGTCAQKWVTFSARGGVGMGSLIHWAEEDGWINPRKGRAGTCVPTTPAVVTTPTPAESLSALKKQSIALLAVIQSDPQILSAWRIALGLEKENANVRP
jgi:hypothetical protein